MNRSVKISAARLRIVPGTAFSRIIGLKAYHQSAGPGSRDYAGIGEEEISKSDERKTQIRNWKSQIGLVLRLSVVQFEISNFGFEFSVRPISKFFSFDRAKSHPPLLKPERLADGYSVLRGTDVPADPILVDMVNYKFIAELVPAHN